MYQFSHSFRVRYSETDRMKYVYYGNYPTYFEVGRVEALRNLGIPYKLIEDSGILLPVREMNIKYLKPAFYDDELTIKTKVPVMPGVRIIFEYEIINSQNEKLTEGNTTLVFVDAETGKVTKAPERILRAFRPYFD